MSVVKAVKSRKALLTALEQVGTSGEIKKTMDIIFFVARLDA